MKYDEERICAIERTWLTPNWIPAKEFHQKASEDVQYLLSVIRESNARIAQAENKIGFKHHPGD